MPGETSVTRSPSSKPLGARVTLSVSSSSTTSLGSRRQSTAAAGNAISAQATSASILCGARRHHAAPSLDSEGLQPRNLPPVGARHPARTSPFMTAPSTGRDSAGDTRPRDVTRAVRSDSIRDEEATRVTGSGALASPRAPSQTPHRFTPVAIAAARGGAARGVSRRPPGRPEGKSPPGAGEEPRPCLLRGTIAPL
jgi:hypothetical protein